ncbi:MAG: zinc-ribbon domain-containing protein [Candidatus Lokiarchaeia archaeon]
MVEGYLTVKLIHRICPNCGAKLEKHKGFCIFCGTQIFSLVFAVLKSLGM